MARPRKEFDVEAMVSLFSDQGPGTGVVEVAKQMGKHRLIVLRNAKEMEAAGRLVKVRQGSRGIPTTFKRVA